MGKSSPKAPAAPDPVVVANAQSAANADTARLQARMNNVNTYGPDGSVVYTPLDNDRWQQNIQLTQDGQQIHDLSNQAQIGALNVANKAVSAVDGLVGKPLDTSGIPALTGSVSPAGLTTSLGAYPAQSMGWNPGQKVQGALAQGPAIQGRIANAGSISTGYDQGGPLMYGSGRTPGEGLVGGVDPGARQSSFAAGGPVQSALGERGNITGSFAPGAKVQDAISGGDPLAYGFDPGQKVQGALGPQGAIASGFGGGGKIESALGPDAALASGFQNSAVQTGIGPGDFTQDRNAVTDAVWKSAIARLDPMWGQQQNQLETRLANQGLGLGSTGYQTAQDQFSRNRNDAYGQALLGAIQQGSDEQNTLFNQALARGSFSNSAAAQQYAQNQGLAQFQNQAAQQAHDLALSSGQFANAAQAQAFGQDQARASFANTAQQQAYDQALGAGQFANQAAEQQFGQARDQTSFANQSALQALQAAQTRGEFANAAQAQAFGQNQAAAQFQNQAQQQAYDQQLGAGQFANAAQAQSFAQNQGLADFYNQNQATMFAQGQQNAALNNAAQGQAYDQGQAAMDAYNRAQGQANAQNAAQAGFGNQAQAQQFAQNSAQQQAYNAALAQLFSQNLQSGQFANQAAAQQFSQGQAQSDAWNQAANTVFQQNLAAAQFGNDAASQQFQQQMAAAQFANQARTQGLQENAYQQNLPLQQFAQLLGMGQVSMPQGVSYSPLSVGQTDVLGAYAMSQAQQNANYQAKMQQQAGLMNGLFQLGSAGITAAATMSDRRLKRDVSRIGALANGLPVYLYRYLWSPVWQIGVMAQDVLKSRPHAVHSVGGFLAVDYGAL